MATSPLISIIIPCYNAQKDIDACLKSIIDQTFQNFEVLIIDGKSTDNTISIIEKCKATNNKIHFFSEKDNGVYDAMNKGISFAKGEYLFFLGTDDILFENNTLEKVFANKQILSSHFLYGNTQFKYNKQIYNGKYTVKKILFGGNICHQAIFYHHTIFKTLGSYDIAYNVYADHDFNIKCFLNKSIKKQYINQIISIYNEQDGISAKNKKDELFEQRVKILQNKYLKSFPYILVYLFNRISIAFRFN